MRPITNERRPGYRRGDRFMKYKRYYAYYALLEPYKGKFGVTFPDLPGACSMGETIDDAIFNAQECLAVHLHGEPEEEIPAPSKREDIEVPKGWQLALVATDVAEYYPEDFEEEEEPKKKSWGGARAGAGRPKNSGRQASKRLVVRMTEEEDELLTRLAVAAQKTKSDYVRELIKQSEKR